MVANPSVQQCAARLDELRPLIEAQPLDRWLCDAECEIADRFRDSGRRLQWLAGRHLAKELIVECFDGQPPTGPRVSRRPLDLRCVFIASRDAVDRSARPRIFVHGRLQDWSLSISHSDSIVYVALSTHGEQSIGVDVVNLEGPNRRLLDRWMTAAERRSFAGSNQTATNTPSTGDHWCAARAWSVKEAAYKAVNRGESFVPAQIEVARDAAVRMTCRLPDSLVPDKLHIEVSEHSGHFFALATTNTKTRRRTYRLSA